jgi:hypothetical protein
MDLLRVPTFLGGRWAPSIWETSYTRLLTDYEILPKLSSDWQILETATPSKPFVFQQNGRQEGDDIDLLKKIIGGFVQSKSMVEIYINESRPRFMLTGSLEESNCLELPYKLGSTRESCSGYLVIQLHFSLFYARSRDAYRILEKLRQDICRRGNPFSDLSYFMPDELQWESIIAVPITNTNNKGEWKSLVKFVQKSLVEMGVDGYKTTCYSQENQKANMGKGGKQLNSNLKWKQAYPFEYGISLKRTTRQINKAADGLINDTKTLQRIAIPKINPLNFPSKTGQDRDAIPSGWLTLREPSSIRQLRRPWHCNQNIQNLNENGLNLNTTRLLGQNTSLPNYFMKLPSEIRNIIYSFLHGPKPTDIFQESGTLSISSDPFYPWKAESTLRERFSWMEPLLYLDNQLYQECASSLFMLQQHAALRCIYCNLRDTEPKLCINQMLFHFGWIPLQWQHQVKLTFFIKTSFRSYQSELRPKLQNIMGHNFTDNLVGVHLVPDLDKQHTLSPESFGVFTKPCKNVPSTDQAIRAISIIEPCRLDVTIAWAKFRPLGRYHDPKPGYRLQYVKITGTFVQFHRLLDECSKGSNNWLIDEVRTIPIPSNHTDLNNETLQALFEALYRTQVRYEW